MIDLRSDTVTKPSNNMLSAMFNAQVGDDVFNEDPTVIKLETELAKWFGMEAGLFCPSGTMCNQIAIKAHTKPIDEIITDKLSHIYYYETGGYAFNSGCSVRLIDGDRGRITAAQVKENIQPDFDWLPISKLVVIENTCNKGGGSVYSLKSMQQISNTCNKYGLKLHLDGARIFNALATEQYSLAQLHGLFSSVSVCLSKGLGAPVGSVLLGSKSFIKYARKIRKAFGGGMRQAGYLAAAGLYALQHNLPLLKTDHLHAKQLEKTLVNLPFVKAVKPVETNIVIFDVDDNIDVDMVLNYLKQHNILAVQFGKHSIRLVTHLNVSAQQIETVCAVLKKMSI